MKTYFLKTGLSIALLFCTVTAYTQQVFEGSFTVTFTEVNNNDTLFSPLLWCKKGKRVVIEIQDEGRRQGISQRVLIDPTDSTWTMILDASNARNAARVHAAKMFRDTAKNSLFKVTRTAMTKSISGYTCKKTVIESKFYKTELWITEQLNFNLGSVYHIIEHCGMMSNYIPTGDWGQWNIYKGMLLQVSTFNKTTAQSYKMTLSQIKPHVVYNNLFNLKNFIIAEIPEGQHCGTSK